MSIDNDKVTEIFCMADDFCRVYDRFVKVNGLATKRDKSKRRYHRDGRVSDAEVITIMILFHLGGHKCLKHFYLYEVCGHMRDLFPRTVSYNRFVELERKVVVPFILFVNRCRMGACMGISFVDSTALRVCRNQRIRLHKVFFKGLAQRGQCSMGWFYGFKLHLICSEKGEFLSFMLTPGNVDDRDPPQEQILHRADLRKAGRGQGIHLQGPLLQTFRGRHPVDNKAEEQHERPAYDSL